MGHCGCGNEGCGAEAALEYLVDEVNLELAKDAVETWIRETDAGKRWLAIKAAEIGAPLQLTLPLEVKG